MSKDDEPRDPLTLVIQPVLRRLWPIAGLCILLVLLGVTPWGLWELDEGRYADVASEMLARGDFVTPRVNGVIFLDKPPMVYWVTAASLSVWGHNEFGARFGQLAHAEESERDKGARSARRRESVRELPGQGGF